MGYYKYTLEPGSCSSYYSAVPFFYLHAKINFHFVLYRCFNSHIGIEDIRTGKNIQLLNKMLHTYAPPFQTFCIYLQEKHSNHHRCLLKKKVVVHENAPIAHCLPLRASANLFEIFPQQVVQQEKALRLKCAAKSNYKA